MYEKVVNYYEENLCLDNMFFRRYYKRWVIGIIVVIILMALINCLISLIVDNLLTRTIVNLLINIVIAVIFLILVYVRNLMKIYREKVKTKVKIDTIGVLMNQERMSEYRKVEIKEMETFLKKECQIKDLKSIDMIIEEIDGEIKNKYARKNFIEKGFNNYIFPILIALLPVYFTNNKEQQLLVMILISILVVLTVVLIVNLISKITDIKLLIPVDKKENLLELKRVLIDIKIKWNE